MGRPVGVLVTVRGGELATADGGAGAGGFQLVESPNTGTTIPGGMPPEEEAPEPEANSGLGVVFMYFGFGSPSS